MKKSQTAVEVVLIEVEALDDDLVEECARVDVFELVRLVELLLVLPEELERVLLDLATTFSSMVL